MRFDYILPLSLIFCRTLFSNYLTILIILNSSIAVLSYTIVSIFIANHFSIQIKPLK